MLIRKSHNKHLNRLFCKSKNKFLRKKVIRLVLTLQHIEKLSKDIDKNFNNYHFFMRKGFQKLDSFMKKSLCLLKADQGRK